MRVCAAGLVAVAKMTSVKESAHKLFRVLAFDCQLTRFGNDDYPWSIVPFFREETVGGKLCKIM